MNSSRGSRSAWLFQCLRQQPRTIRCSDPEIPTAAAISSAPFCERRERQHREPQQHRRKHHDVDRRPAVIRQQLARRKRTQRHRAEHQKIVEGLNLVALLRPMRLQHQRGGADETEIPAHAEHDQRGPEMHRGDAGKSDRRGDGLQQQAERDNAGAPKRAISEPVKKLGPYIATICHWMPKLESLTLKPAHLHRQRRRGHDQIHHRIGDDAANRRGDEPRLPHDLEQRAAAVQIGRRGLRRIDPDSTTIATSATTACTTKLKANR